MTSRNVDGAAVGRGILRWSGGTLLFVWELPQNVLGLINLHRQWRRNMIANAAFERVRWFIQLKDGQPISLGLFLFWADERSRYVTEAEVNRLHEYGHSIQSRLLGPLYLPLIGIPSVMRALYAIWYRRHHGHGWHGFYDGFPESWADRLAGVKSKSPAAIQDAVRSDRSLQ